MGVRRCGEGDSVRGVARSVRLHEQEQEEVLDGLGAQLDPETAGSFDEDVRNALIVGRPVGDARS